MAAIENNFRGSPWIALMTRGVLGGIFSFIVISIMLQPLHFEPGAVLGVALGGAIVTGGFLVRERYLTGRVQSLDDEYRNRDSRAVSLRDRFFQQSVAAFARFDAVSFRVREASQGLVEMTGRKPDEDVLDRSMVDVLLTESSTFREVTDAIRREGPSASFLLDCKRKDGQHVQVRVNGLCRTGEGVIDMALTEVAAATPQVQELEEKEGDLERFRQGMIRREFRILELKNEINSLCDETGRKRRYRIDSETRDVLVEELMREKQEVEPS